MSNRVQPNSLVRVAHYIFNVLALTLPLETECAAQTSFTHYHGVGDLRLLRNEHDTYAT